MIKKTIGHTIINLPELDQIPVPKTRAALEKALEIHALAVRAEQDHYAASDARMNAFAKDQERLGRIFADNPTATEVNPNELQDVAQRAEAEAMSRRAGLETAELHAVQELRTAIDAEADVWAKISAANARKGLTKLTTATKLAEAARAELADSIGVLGLLAGETGSTGIAVAQNAGGHTFDINPAIDHLRNAIVEASRELEEWKR